MVTVNIRTRAYTKFAKKINNFQARLQLPLLSKLYKMFDSYVQKHINNVNVFLVCAPENSLQSIFFIIWEHFREFLSRQENKTLRKISIIGTK